MRLHNLIVVAASLTSGALATFGKGGGHHGDHGHIDGEFFSNLYSSLAIPSIT